MFISIILTDFRPGRECEQIRTQSAVSCFALSDEVGNCITTGSWNSHITHYDKRLGKLSQLFTLRGHKSGITMLRYLRENGHCRYLFSGARKDNNLYQWDMRNYRIPLRAFKREVATNQRISFDISSRKNWLISGDTRGFLNVWSLLDPQVEFQVCQSVVLNYFIYALHWCVYLFSVQIA